MSNWSTYQFTRKGEQLRAKVESGKCKLTLTKIKIGNGNVAIGEVKDMNDLKSPQLVLGISSCDVSAEDDRICEVVGIASSSNVESAFSVTEMGLYANDPDVGEILYLVGIDTAPDDMPNKNAQSIVTLTYQFELVTSNMANVVAVISPAGLVTVKMMNDHRTASELDHPDGSVTTAKIHNEAVTGEKIAKRSVTGDHIANGAIAKEHLSASIVTLISDSGIAILQRSRAYQVGDIAYSKHLPSWARLECVKAGTTGTTLPDKIKQTLENGGVLITDGTVVWIIDDLRDGTPVGAVRGSLYLPAGYVKANGATVQRADYPRLVALADKHNLWTDDTAANAGLFGRGDGSTTMVLPNWMEVEGYANDDIGRYILPGAPEITGGYSRSGDHLNYGAPYSPYGSISADSNHVDFKASRSNPIYGRSDTVQSAAIKLIPIIRY
ncbi:phage tail protein [Selenomonas noxia]|uniref:phage tail protein n=1 Tax=Selenomonas noxia TaxID=135083 RepID=UPI0020613508|nr:phage tail protein [Selenomonas noxia]DAS62053.1 MAG TPA: tail collar fiber protein [Caudoviricetes sp.]